jgi:hypothetical protein
LQLRAADGPLHIPVGRVAAVALLYLLGDLEEIMSQTVVRLAFDLDLSVQKQVSDRLQGLQGVQTRTRSTGHAQTDRQASDNNSTMK